MGMELDGSRWACEIEMGDDVYHAWLQHGSGRPGKWKTISPSNDCISWQGPLIMSS